MTTYYWYNFVSAASGHQAIINSSETPLPKPVIGDEVSVSAKGVVVSGKISRVTVDINQDAKGDRTLAYAITVS